MNKVIIQHCCSSDPSFLQKEIDKTKSISDMTNEELERMNARLSMELRAEEQINQLRRNSGERGTYEQSLITDTSTPINQLYHHGILGQKWGIRRFQNKDGSLTEKGKREEQNKEVKQQRKQISKARRYLSEGDLKKLTERLEMEKKVKNLVDKDVSPGVTKAKTILSQIGSGIVTGSGIAAGTALATYAIKAALEGKFDLKDAAAFIKPKK